MKLVKQKHWESALLTLTPGIHNLDPQVHTVQVSPHFSGVLTIVYRHTRNYRPDNHTVYFTLGSVNCAAWYSNWSFSRIERVTSLLQTSYSQLLQRDHNT